MKEVTSPILLSSASCDVVVVVGVMAQRREVMRNEVVCDLLPLAREAPTVLLRAQCGQATVNWAVR